MHCALQTLTNGTTTTNAFKILGLEVVAGSLLLMFW